MDNKGLAWEAGVWEQNMGFVGWSHHSTEGMAVTAARKYARRLCRRGPGAGGTLSWAGGVRAPRGGAVTWYDGGSH